MGAGNSAFELLQKMPGVGVDANENLLLKGSPTNAVMIDGKITYLFGTQFSNLLKRMGADNTAALKLSTCLQRSQMQRAIMALSIS